MPWDAFKDIGKSDRSSDSDQPSAESIQISNSRVMADFEKMIFIALLVIYDTIPEMVNLRPFADGCKRSKTPRRRRLFKPFVDKYRFVSAGLPSKCIIVIDNCSFGLSFTSLCFFRFLGSSGLANRYLEECIYLVVIKTRQNPKDWEIFFVQRCVLEVETQKMRIGDFSQAGF